MTAVDTRRTYGFYGTQPKRAPRPLSEIPELWVQVEDGVRAAPIATDPPARPRRRHPALAPDDPRHGTINGYGNLACRCDACKAANAAYQRKLRLERHGRPIPDHVHGTENGYARWYCKCDACRAAHKATLTPSPRRVAERARTEAMYQDYCRGLTVPQVAEKYGLTPGAVYSRFQYAGYKRRDTTSNAGGMYFDYCTGMSIAQIAEKWGCSVRVVQSRLSQLRVPLRPRRGGTVQVRVPAGTTFDAANKLRSATAGVRRAEAARKALAVTTDERWRQVLQLRIDDPVASLAQLGLRCTPPMTKDAFASHLRRALINAGVAS